MSYSKHFSIDDAFEDESLDEIKVISSSVENSPFQYPSQNRVLNYGGIMHDSVKNLKSLKDTSHDRDSLICNGKLLYTSKERGWWHHPQVRENWRVVLTVILLLFIGIGLLSVAIAVVLIPITNYNALVFFIVGFICFIPGAYHVVYIYLAAKGCPGYSFYSLSLFN
ncbi:transmembrane protein 134 [Daktulosphaira vitifoliae]|uniref:transmembrane protein 134 n=1 Tax=Daktulosphaira vitifoliae TaxID=58002 RepID=UPI0021A9FC60|nr:transmembrane protein 134 [Daktulosphaira vitifoliae]